MLQLGLKGTHLTLVLALKGAHLTLDCSDPVGRGVLRISNDRQHGRADRRHPTVEAIAIAELDTHPPFPFPLFGDIPKTLATLTGAAARPGISANKFMSLPGAQARNRTRRNGESLAWPVVPRRHLPRSRAGSGRVGRLLANICATLQRVGDGQTKAASGSASAVR